jgi:two-component system, NarL family, response regulator YdfI
MIRVLVVATAAVTRAGLSAALSIDPAIEVVGTVANLDVLIAEVDRSQLDAILLDLGDFPQTSAWEKLHLFQATQAPSSLPIALYDWEGDLPTSTESELCAAMVAIAKGWLVLPSTAMELFDLREKVAIHPVPILTPREIEVLVQIGAGLGNKAIAQNLYISDHYVTEMKSIENSVSIFRLLQLKLISDKRRTLIRSRFFHP